MITFFHSAFLFPSAQSIFESKIAALKSNVYFTIPDSGFRDSWLPVDERIIDLPILLDPHDQIQKSGSRLLEMIH